MSSEKSKTPDPKAPSAGVASQYLLLIRNTAWQKDFSAAEIEKVLEEFSAWVTCFKNDGTIKVAVPLVHRGKLFESKDVIVDGPFIESKEAIAGLIIFEAEKPIAKREADDKWQMTDDKFAKGAPLNRSICHLLSVICHQAERHISVDGFGFLAKPRLFRRSTWQKHAPIPFRS